MKKTHLLHFVTKKQAEIQQQIVISNTVIKNISSTRFLGLLIDTTLSWKDNITEITPKLNKASYIVRTLIFLRSPKYSEWCTFLTFSQLCHTVLYFGVNPITVLKYSKFKNE